MKLEKLTLDDFYVDEMYQDAFISKVELVTYDRFRYTLDFKLSFNYDDYIEINAVYLRVLHQ